LPEPLPEGDQPDPEKHNNEDNKEKEGGLLSFLGELPVLILTAIIVAWLIKTFLVQPFYIPSGSMEPTLYPGDRVLASKLSYRFGEPEVGDIVIFIAPEAGETEQDFIKRIVATSGMTVRVEQGKLIVDGKVRRENFTKPDRETSMFGPYTVPPGDVFVMGDNRANSRDSRFFGPVEKDAIIGKAFFIYWPPNRVGLIN
jgi:signal peptidase I